MDYTMLYGVESCKSEDKRLSFPSANQILIDNKNAAMYILCINDKSYAVHGEIKFSGELGIHKLNIYHPKNIWPSQHHVALRANDLDELIIFCKDIQHTDEINGVLDALIKS